MPVLLESCRQMFHAVPIDIPELPLGCRMASQRCPVHHASDAHLNGPGGDEVHENAKTHLLRAADLLKASIGSQRVLNGEGSAGLNVAVYELPEFLPGCGANLRWDVLPGASVELSGAVVTVEPVNAHYPRSGHENFSHPPKSDVAFSMSAETMVFSCLPSASTIPISRSRQKSA